jgi:hypothetical protein
VLIDDHGSIRWLSLLIRWRRLRTRMPSGRRRKKTGWLEILTQIRSLVPLLRGKSWW